MGKNFGCWKKRNRDFTVNVHTISLCILCSQNLLTHATRPFGSTRKRILQLKFSRVSKIFFDLKILTEDCEAAEKRRKKTRLFHPGDIIRIQRTIELKNAFITLH